MNAAYLILTSTAMLGMPPAAPPPAHETPEVSSHAEGGAHGGTHGGCDTCAEPPKQSLLEKFKGKFVNVHFLQKKKYEFDEPYHGHIATVPLPTSHAYSSPVFPAAAQPYVDHRTGLFGKFHTKSGTVGGCDTCGSTGTPAAPLTQPTPAETIISPATPAPVITHPSTPVITNPPVIMPSTPIITPKQMEPLPSIPPKKMEPLPVVPSKVEPKKMEPLIPSKEAPKKMPDKIGRSAEPLPVIQPTSGKSPIQINKENPF